MRGRLPEFAIMAGSLWRALVAGALLSLCSTSLQAGIVFSSSFETPVLSPTTPQQPVNPGSYLQVWGGQTVDGWTVHGSDVVLMHTTYNEPFPGLGNPTFNSQDGDQSLDITGVGNTTPLNAISRLVDLEVGAQYLLSFYVGRADSSTGYYQTPATIGLSIDGSSIIDFTNSNLTSQMVNWQLFTYTFTALTSQTSILFKNQTPHFSPEGENNFAGLDDVRLEYLSGPASIATTPEPASLSMAALGLATFLCGRSRWGRKAKP